MASRAGEAVNLVATGERQGSATAAALPSVVGKWVKIKALSSNAGIVYIGDASVTVTKADGTTDTTAGWPLLANDETDWIPLGSNNLNELSFICDNAGDDIVYMVLG